MNASDAGAVTPAFAGRVRDAVGPLSDGRVVLVPAATVAAMAARAVPRFGDGPTLADQLGDEPIEDAIDDSGADFASTPIGAAGEFAFETLPEGSAFFVYYAPALDDDAHLPGGSLVRTALSPDSLRGSRLDILVSGRPSSAAHYVGSDGCVACHGRHRFFSTAHRVSLTVPGNRGAFQDAVRFPEQLDRLRAAFRAGTTLYFSDCDDGGGARARCAVTDVDPGGSVFFQVELAEESSVGAVPRYSATLRNRQGAGSERYEVPLVYGGLLSRQRVLVALPSRAAGGVRYPGPFALNLAGYDAAPDRADRAFVDAGSERFYDFAAGLLRRPDSLESVERNCAGCHFTGYALGDDGESASAVASLGGAFDVDGDGRLDEINVGCESCHGPGSEHIEAPVRGAFIVSPGKLTAARATLICGGCHSRTVSAHPAGVAAPLDRDGLMPRPGMRRAAYLRWHVGDTTGLSVGEFASGDGRHHYQQYDEFLQSTKHRNGEQLLACDSCHDPHGSSLAASEPPLHDLRTPDDNDCVDCHPGTADVRQHVEATTQDPHAATADAEFRCAVCHMPSAGTRGARQPGLFDIFPRTATPFQYSQGDVPSHRFRRYSQQDALVQPTSFNRACAVCHGEFLDNP